MSSRHLGRAAGVAALWGALAAPVALGWQRCTMAAVLHVPCPGCGTTRALALLARGDWGASLRLQPLAVPMLGAAGLVVLATVRTTLRSGAPRLEGSRLGRWAVGVAASVYGAAVLLWGLRWLGLFGGPVAV